MEWAYVDQAVLRQLDGDSHVNFLSADVDAAHATLKTDGRLLIFETGEALELTRRCGAFGPVRFTLYLAYSASFFS